MSGNYYSNDPDFDEFGQQETGSGLRKQLEDALKELRELRGELKAEKQGKAVDALLKEKGLDPKVKDLIPQDANPSEWLSTYGALFGTHLDAGNEEPGQAQPPAPPADHVAEAQAQQQMSPSGDAGGNTTTQQDPLQQLAAIKTEEEFLTFLRQQQGGGNYLDGGLWG